MKKRFFRYLLGIALLTLFLSTVASMFVFYSGYAKRSNEDLRNIVMTMGESLNKHEDDIAYLEGLANKKLDFRITLIREDGEVLYDSKKDVKLLPSHKDRPEVIEAKKLGYAQVERYSNTLSKDLYYVSLRLDDGNMIRISREMDNLVGAFTKVLPLDILMSLVIFVVAAFVSSSLTKKTFDPLNNLEEDLINIDTNIFPEISPFINRIKRQKLTIDENYKEIARERDTINTILKNMRESLVIVDENKNLLTVNDSAREIFNSKRDILGENIINLIRDEEILKMADEALEGKSTEAITRIGNRDYKCYVNPVFEDKRVRGLLILFIDETEEIRALRLREEFSSNVSHELKTPLTSISGFSELLVNNLVEDKDKEGFYKLIYNDSKRLLSLVEDIMKISGLENAGDYDKEEVDLREIISEILKGYEGLIEEKNIKVNFEGDGSLFENRTMIWELFSNLINNGLKYNKEGGRLDIKISEEEENYKVHIADTGIGIPQEDLARIFERFYRVDKSRSRRVGGTGLGLSIVKHILQNIDGKVKIYSQLGKGTTFELLLKKSKKN
ncbi:PAS domain-containing protein [Peptoniphilus harei]|uniref:histidine kinase n=1 Tax=Peptoniphilus harei TaxID=54005 RepID=A0A2X1ZUP1_9FIRM|nr:ATP-binding protein [Peptoniphilus harei]QQT90528.1 PAS domain-containing protein [Peptoniphilus harei]SPY47875.1 Alkaline phosphatase synthesis sensor protein phoR [Peptoniphilus harei]